MLKANQNCSLIVILTMCAVMWLGGCWRYSVLLEAYCYTQERNIYVFEIFSNDCLKKKRNFPAEILKCDTLPTGPILRLI